MPGYIERLLQRVRPDGIKGAQTPAQYQPPNFKHPGAQTATVDLSPLATDEDKKLLQSVIGTLLYYSRAVDPSICTAVHALGSVQSKPTLNDMKTMIRLLQYVSTHRNIGIRYYASNMILNMLSDASFLSRPMGDGLFRLLGIVQWHQWTYFLRKQNDNMRRGFSRRGRVSGRVPGGTHCSRTAPHSARSGLNG